jgi:hypothetical protein
MFEGANVGEITSRSEISRLLGPSASRRAISS